MEQELTEKALINQIKNWQSRGLLSDDVADGLILDIHSKQTASPFIQNKVIRIVTILGGLLVGLGILLFIAGNWKFIPDWGKMLMIFAIVIGFHYFGLRLAPRMRGSQLPKIFHFIGTLSFAGGIILLGQIFHLNAEYTDAFFWMAIGAVPLAYAVGSRPTLSFGLLAGYAWLMGSLWSEGMLVVYYPVVFTSLGLGIYLVGEIQERLGIETNLTNAFKNLGSFTVVATLFVASFESARPQAVKSQLLQEAKMSYFPDKIVVVLAAALIFFLYSAYLQRDKLGKAYGLVGMVILVVLTIWQTTLGEQAVETELTRRSYLLVANLSLVIALVFFFSEGVRGKDKTLVNIALVGVVLVIIARYADYFAAFLPRSLAFSIGGLILLGLGYLLEKKRKDIYRQFGIS